MLTYPFLAHLLFAANASLVGFFLLNLVGPLG
jgi:hypothetical protein